MSKLYLLLVFTLVFSTQTTAQGCGDVCDQSLEILAAGGSKPYSYLWSDGQTTAIATELCRGTAYTCVVTDANGHAIPGSNYLIFNGATFLFGNSYTIPGTAPMTLQLTTTETAGCDGSATVTPANGTAPYQYAWSVEGETTGTTSGLCPGEYQVTVTDGNSCVAISTFTILGALPVKILDFSAKTQSHQVMLNWSTSSELNNQGFDIERSADGLSWNKLAYVKGEATTNNVNHYSFQDRLPDAGINYYRLKQINFNGTFEYSSIVSIRIKKFQEMAIFPNPTKGMLEIQGFDYNSIRVLDKTGRLLFVQSGSSTVIDISGFPTGIYFVQVISDAASFTRKIIKK